MVCHVSFEIGNAPSRGVEFTKSSRSTSESQKPTSSMQLFRSRLKLIG